MALGTAESTPLQVATAYTMFANLGDRVFQRRSHKITAGDGRTVSTPQPDRKNVVRPDVAYIMDDMLKDVINRGTAAQAVRGVSKTFRARRRSRERPVHRVTAGSPVSRRRLSASSMWVLTMATIST